MRILRCLPLVMLMLAAPAALPAADKPDVKIPKSLLRRCEMDYPGSRFAPVRGNAIQGDFDGDKRADYAMILVATDTDYAVTVREVLVAYLQRDGYFARYELSKNLFQEISPSHIRLFKKGETVTEIFTAKEAKLPFDAIKFITPEQAAMAYFFRGDRFGEIPISE